MKACRTGKKQYHDESEAKQARQNIKGHLAVGNLRDTGRVPRRVYQCNWCHKWHLTSTEER